MARCSFKISLFYHIYRGKSYLFPSAFFRFTRDACVVIQITLILYLHEISLDHLVLSLVSQVLCYFLVWYDNLFIYKMLFLLDLVLLLSFRHVLMYHDTLLTKQLLSVNILM